ncbi:hypothetical protein C9374_000095 [Naegleria lovaniensis]|uniref:Zn(2)-C6 fungal-type domain-containing protein n=1 Tax=Naegleria lovaniensis TaxID=51637 RepID=A0AA88GZ45_NAELO|nr:uncharacterized protein C9374_000095 [Naegleria lovaniensis]KAG2388656.1 hypothetical protein C9374_000095 [Naegleria lovaniensis]
MMNNSSEDYFDNDDEPRDPNASYHPIACSTCRSMHKKCDKKLPICSECLLRGRECIYNIPKKKGRIRGGKNKKKKPEQGLEAAKTPSSLFQQPCLSTASSSSDALVSTTVGSNSTTCSPQIDLIRQRYAQRKDPYPTISPGDQDLELRKRLTSLIPTTLNNLLSENYSLYKQFLKRNTIDTYYNIISSGHPVVAKKVFEDFLFNDSQHQNTELMAWYFRYKREGDDSRARFYLNTVDHYFNDKALLDHEALSQEVKNLDKWKTVTKLSIDSQNFHSTDDDHFMCNRLSLIYRYATGRQMPEEYMTIARQQITPQNVISYLGLLDSVCSFLTLHNQTFAFTPEQRELSSITDAMVYHGSRMRILIEAGIRGHLIEVSANKIIDETVKGTFPMVPVALASVVAGACKVHLSIIRMIRVGKRVNGADGVDYYEYVAKGLRALRILGTRYGRVLKFCSIIMKEQEEVIEGKFAKSINSLEDTLTTLPVQTSTSRFEELPSTYTTSSSSSSSFSTSSPSSGETHSTPQQLPVLFPSHQQVISAANTVALHDPSVSELLAQICNSINMGNVANSRPLISNNAVNSNGQLPPSFVEMESHSQNFEPPPHDMQSSSTQGVLPTYGTEVFMHSEELEQILDSFEQENTQNFNAYE